MNFIKPFIISGVIFLILDICWLFFANKKIYQPNIGNLMGDFKVIPAIIFYIIYLGALTFFVLMPGLEKNSITYVLLMWCSTRISMLFYIRFNKFGIN